MRESPIDRLGLAFKLVLGRVPNALEKQKLTSALDYLSPALCIQ